MDRGTFLGAGALLLAACGDAAVDSGDYADVRVVNSTGLPNVVLTVSDESNGSGSTIWTFSEPDDPPAVVGTLIRTAGEPVQFHVEAGEEITDRTCHVHADAIDDPSNVPTAVIYGQPLRVACQSGWQEEEAAAVWPLLEGDESRAFARCGLRLHASCDSRRQGLLSSHAQLEQSVRKSWTLCT